MRIDENILLMKIKSDIKKSEHDVDALGKNGEADAWSHGYMSALADLKEQIERGDFKVSK